MLELCLKSGVQAAVDADMSPGSIPLELETAMPVRHASSWAVNDSMRVLGMLFPPCGDGAGPGDEHDGSCEDAEEQSGGQVNGGALHTAAAACMPAARWFSAALEVPDYVEFFAQPLPQRHLLHGIALLLMAPVMALMRFTIPTISADFYDAGIFLASCALAAFTAVPLYGLDLPLWLLVALTVSLTCVAIIFLTFGVRFSPPYSPAGAAALSPKVVPRSCASAGAVTHMSDDTAASVCVCMQAHMRACCLQGFGIPDWIQGQSVVPRLCVLAFSAVTLFMAVGWIQFLAGELVGCMQALGNVVKCPPVLLGFTLAAVNSFGDQATNLSLARTNGKRAAFAACFSGMAFNLCLASAYGWFLYTQKYGVSSVPLQISIPTWILWVTMVAYLLGMLCVLAGMKLSMGALCIPQVAGRWFQLTFMLLLLGFCAAGIVQWHDGAD